MFGQIDRGHAQQGAQAVFGLPLVDLQLSDGGLVLLQVAQGLVQVQLGLAVARLVAIFDVVQDAALQFHVGLQQGDPFLVGAHRDVVLRPRRPAA